MTLTAEEQAAIESYNGPVQKIPLGTSGEPLARWDERENKLRNVHPCGRPYSVEESRDRFRNHGFRPDQKVAHRRKRVKELAQTMTIREMAAHLGCGEHQVRNDVKTLDIKAKAVDRRGMGRTKAHAEAAARRRVKVQELIDSGVTQTTKIAEALGACRRTIRHDLAYLRGKS